MHSTLRDRATTKTTVITVSLLCASVFSIAFAFAGDVEHVTLVGVTATRSTWLGILAVLILCGTVTDLITDDRGIARRHDSAVKLLADLKAGYQQVDPTESVSAREARLSERYKSVLAQIPAIPENKFNKLKAHHLRKVEVSKILSDNPGMTERQAVVALKRRVSS